VNHSVRGEFGPFTIWPDEQDAGAPPRASRLCERPLPFRKEAALLYATLVGAQGAELLDQRMREALDPLFAGVALWFHPLTIPAEGSSPSAIRHKMRLL
jgi:hypothetical protein